MSTDLINKLKTIVADTLEIDVDQIIDSLCAKNCPEWDSARHIAIVMAIEDEFGIEFVDDDFAKMTDFSALSALVVAKVASL